MSDLKQRMIDHMNEHWSSDPPLEGQASPGHKLDPASPYAQWREGQYRDIGLAQELIGEDNLLWDDDTKKWVVR